MSSIWNKVWKSTPKIDCNLCGLVTCANFARNIVAGKIAISACPIMSLPQFSENLDEITKITSSRRSITPKVAAEIPEGGILLTKPCRDTNERVMAELRISNGLDPGDKIRFSVFDAVLLCELIEFIRDRFDSLKCSKDLGYGRADTGELSITLLHDGRINMRRVLDKESVIHLFREIERAVFGAMICNCCGCDLLSILTGEIEPEMALTHTIFEAGTTFSFNIDDLPGFTSKIFQEHGNEHEEFLLKLIRSGIDLLDETVESLTKGKDIKTFRTRIQKLKSKVVSSISNSENFGFELLYLITLSSLHLIENAISGLLVVKNILKDSKQEDKLGKLLQIANQGEFLGDFPEDAELAWAYAQLCRLKLARHLMNPFFSG